MSNPQAILILKTPPPKMRMQIVEEKKQLEFAARSERARQFAADPMLPAAPVADVYNINTRAAVHHATNASSPEPLADSPTSPKKVTLDFNRRFRSASEYSDDSRKSSLSPVTRTSRTMKAFNFGSAVAHSDEEEEIIESAVYRTVCAKKLAEAELPVPEKKPSRRYSQMGRNSISNSPSSPLSPLLKSVSMRPMPAEPMSIEKMDGIRAVSTESMQTKIFQPSPLPGQVYKCSPDLPATTNSDSFLSLAERPATAHTFFSGAPSAAGIDRGFVNTSEQFNNDQSGNKSKKVLPAKTGYDWLRNYKCSMRKCVSPITEGWKRPDGGSEQSGRMLAIFETGFYIVGNFAQK
jgi:hypothetical protein